MLNPKVLDEMAKKLADNMPAAVTDFKNDIEKNLRAGLQNTLSKLNLVTREEFDVQSKVLAATRARVEQLQKQVASLEAILRPNASTQPEKSPGQSND